MDTYYFTYGLEGHPFPGGWTEIEAPDGRTAIAVFRAFHPDIYEGILNCAFFYKQEIFKRTSMYEKGNFGKRCVERIRIERELVDE